MQNLELAICRSSAKFTVINLCWILFFNKVACEFSQNFMSNFLIEHLRMTASENETLFWSKLIVKVIDF